MEYLLIIGQTIVAIIVIMVVARFTNSRLVKHFEGKPHLAFRRQLIQLAGVLIIILTLILFLPLDATLRGQLLSLYGIIISATIALSSTTLVGNVMAGIMLKTIKSCRPGYYITVGDHFVGHGDIRRALTGLRRIAPRDRETLARGSDGNRPGIAIRANP